MTPYDGALLSYGGGVNTVAMLLRLVDEGWRGQIVFADTGGEHPETYCHMAWVEENVLQPVGMSIIRLSYADPAMDPTFLRKARGTRSGGEDHMFGKTLEGYCLFRRIIPLLAIRWCSVQFKQTLLKGYAVEHGNLSTLVGIGSDEPNRIREDAGLLYPLNDWGWSRRDCIDYIRKKHVPVPRKSGCFYCPAQKRSEWRDLLHDNPELYERAAAMERRATERTGKAQTLDPTGQQSLDQLRKGFESQQSMSFESDADMRAYEPCICGL